MSKQINFMILAIVEAALRVNQMGRVHVFVDLAGHISGVSVRIVAANVDYGARDYSVAQETAYYGDDHYAWLRKDEREPAAIKQLNLCLDLIVSHASKERAA